MAGLVETGSQGRHSSSSTLKFCSRRYSVRALHPVAMGSPPFMFIILSKYSTLEHSSPSFVIQPQANTHHKEQALHLLHSCRTRQQRRIDMQENWQRPCPATKNIYIQEFPENSKHFCNILGRPHSDHPVMVDTIF